MTASLYVHVPFCAGACDYCDFYSIPVSPGDRRIDLFIDAVLREGEQTLRRHGVAGVPTVYIGGGTPSVLGAAGIRRLLEGLAALLPEGVQEFSVEANPESADGPFLEACREQGVTRISLGVQSFFEPARRAVHRVGAGSPLAARLRLVRNIFESSFSADLITGLPLQDETILLRDLEKLLSFEPGHVSLYSLTVEPGTPLERRARRAASAAGDSLPAGEPALPVPDEADRLWIRGRDFLEQAGYAQYEVSNFARPGKRCRHNIRYWRMENWLGIGPAASGTIIDDTGGAGRRYTAGADVETYLREPEVHVEELDWRTLMEETLLMGFRYIEGPDPALFRRRFGLALEEAVPASLAAWRKKGALRHDRCAMTGAGLLFLDSFLADAFGEIS